MMSGALLDLVGAFGVEGVDGAAFEAPMECSTADFVERVGVDHHLDIDTVSAIERQQSIAAGVVPSSCSFSAQDGLDHSLKRRGRDASPLPGKPRSTGKSSAAWIMRKRWNGRAYRRTETGPCAAPGAVSTPGDAEHQSLFLICRGQIN